MKKIYTLLMALMSMLCVCAQTSTETIPFTFCVYITDPSVCYVQDNNYNRVDVKAGENVFQATYYKTTYSDGSGYGYLDSFYLYIDYDKQSDYMITGCEVLSAGERTPYQGFYGPTTSLNLTTGLTPEMDGCTLYPVISSLDELRTATATVIVNDASKVRIQCGNNGYSPVLADGENTVRFDPANESYWRIGAASYGEYLGGVTVNGVAQTEMYGSYEIRVSPGDVIVIDTEASTEPCNVSFSFTNPDTEKAVEAVYNYVNYSRQPVADWQSGFQVDMRGQIVVALDMNTYNITSVTVNGQEQQLYSPELYITITGDTEICITARPYSTFDITLTLSDPSHISIGMAETQYAGMTELTGLVSGTQTLKISDKMHYLIVNPVSGAVIDKVSYTADGTTTEVEAGYSGYYVPIEAGTSVEIVSHMILREAQATLWINDINKVYSLYLQYKDGSNVFNTYGEEVPVTGDQSFKFDPESDNPFSLYFSPTDYETPGYVTVNGLLVEPKYEGSTAYELTLANGDVVKVYAGEVYNSGIEDVSVGAADNSVYDLMGRKVDGNNRPVHGIFIMGGRKVIR